MDKKENYLDSIRNELLTKVEPNIHYCYQCGKCTAGCPLSDVYDWQPNEVIRLIQINKIDVSCEICSSRCPQEVDIAAVMNFLRIKSWQHRQFKLKKIGNFYMIFLKIIQKLGRSYEPLLILTLNILNRRFLNDFDLIPAILWKRKIRILPVWTKKRKEVSAIVKEYL
jgi:heterodisulfide reductase subunit C